MSYPTHGPEYHERLLEGAEILDLSTAETDAALVLAPDGAGGVEFRAETGGGGGGGGSSDVGVPLITGEDHTFATTVGAWTAYGSHNTLSRESGTNLGYPGTGGGSGENLKIASTQGDGLDAGAFNMPASGAKLTVAPTDGFKAGRVYVFSAFVAVEVNPLASSAFSFMYVGLLPDGLAGVGPFLVQATLFGTTPYKWQLVRLQFRPLIDSASVDVVIGRGDSSVVAQAFHVAGGVWGPSLMEVDLPSPFAIGSVGAYVTGDMAIQHSELAGGPRLSMNARGMSIQGRDNGSADPGEVDVGENGSVGIYGPHASPGDLVGEGINIEVGEDWVGFYISEKDSDTIQIYDDSGGSYDIELVEQDAGRHFKLIHVDGGVAIPALGMLPQYASAPHAGVEQEGESYWDLTLHKPRSWDGSAWQNWF